MLEVSRIPGQSEDGVSQRSERRANGEGASVKGKTKKGKTSAGRYRKRNDSGVVEGRRGETRARRVSGLASFGFKLIPAA